jgi:hypothetical protein
MKGFLKNMSILYIYIISCIITSLLLVSSWYYIEIMLININEQTINKMTIKQLIISILFDFFFIVLGYIIINKFSIVILNLLGIIDGGLEEYTKEYFSASSLIIALIFLHSPLHLRYKMTKLTKYYHHDNI